MTIREILSHVLDSHWRSFERAGVRVILELEGELDEPFGPGADAIGRAVGHLLDRALATFEAQAERRLAIRGRSTDGMVVLEIEYPLAEPARGGAAELFRAFHSGCDEDAFGIVGCRARLAACGCGCRSYIGTAWAGSIRVVLEIPTLVPAGEAAR